MRAPRSRRLDAEIPELGAHLDLAARQLADPRVGRLDGGPRDREQARQLLGRQIEQEAIHGFCRWPWRERSTGELVGFAGLNRDQVEGEAVVEVGWSITPDRWGEGLATEAAKSSLQRAAALGLAEIVSFALPDNVASRRVMEKLGMEYVREFERADRPHVLYRTLIAQAQPIAT